MATKQEKTVKRIGNRRTRAAKRAQLVEELNSLSTTDERMRFVQEHTTHLGTAGIDAISIEIGHLERVGDARRRRRGYCPGNARMSQAAGNPIPLGLANYLYLGEHHKEAVRLAFRLLRCVDVSDDDLRDLFLTEIGRGTCCVDHYGRVEVALDELEVGGLSDDGSLEAYIACLIATGLMCDEDVASGARTAMSDSLRGSVSESDTEALLSVRGRLVAWLADLAEDKVWGDLASSIALGYIGCRDLDEGLVSGTHALVAPHFTRFARLGTYDGCFDAALFCWGCDRSGIDAASLSKALSPSPAQSLALTLTRVLCDQHQRDLDRGGLDTSNRDRRLTGMDDALDVARGLTKEDWGEFVDLVSGLGMSDRHDVSGNSYERVALSRWLIGEMGPRLLEERAGGTEILDLVLAATLAATPSRDYRRGAPIVAYLYDRRGNEDGRKLLAKHVRSRRDWWLKRFGEVASSRRLDHGVATTLASLDMRGELLDFGTICASQRLVGGDFAVEYLPRVCAHVDKRRGHRYASVPDDAEEFRRVAAGVFTDDASKDLLSRLVVSLFGTPDRPSDEVVAEVLRMCPTALERLLSVGKRRLAADDFARIVLIAYGEDEALDVVSAQVEATHRGIPEVRRFVNALEHEALSREQKRPARRASHRASRI